jgi:hypothetical protein
MQAPCAAAGGPQAYIYSTAYCLAASLSPPGSPLFNQVLFTASFGLENSYGTREWAFPWTFLRFPPHCTNPPSPVFSPLSPQCSPPISQVNILGRPYECRGGRGRNVFLHPITRQLEGKVRHILYALTCLQIIHLE